MKKIKESKIFKLIVHILLIITIFAVIQNGVVLVFNYIYPEKNEGKEYSQTEEFGQELLRRVFTEVGSFERYYNTNDQPLEYLGDSINNKLLIQDTEQNLYVSNIKNNEDYEQIKTDILNQKYYIIVENGEITSNIEGVENQSVYIDGFFNEYNYWFGFNEIKDLGQNFEFNEELYNFIPSSNTLSIELTPVYILIIFILLIYLIISEGHSKENKRIKQNGFQKLPIELHCILVAVFVILLLISLRIIAGYTYDINELEFTFQTMFNTLIVIYITSYIVGITFLLTIINKIKTKTFFSSSLIIRIIKKIFTLIKKVCKNIKYVIFENIPISLIVIGTIIGYAIMTIILTLILQGFGFLISIVLGLIIMYFVLKYLRYFTEIVCKVEKISNGEIDIKVMDNKYIGDLKKLSNNIDKMSEAVNIAVEEKMKSERLKTELITNVSHDIKTPLTSIINYVDLLKNENIEDVKIKEYIEILDIKSIRLKKLIEDLIEMSKSTTNNLKLEKININLLELIKQQLGEYSDRFSKLNLDVVFDVEKNMEYMILTDSKYINRIFDNLFSNIEKYSMPNTRVYIKLNKINSKISIEIKNISKSKLNINEEELFERFTRGDKSRTEEGSGLGLTISKSLVEQLNGNINIEIDGDLFKVEIIFNV